jgi:hypothetical protein
MDSVQNASPSEMISPASQVPSNDSQIGILLCRDLIFTTKVKETALTLGYNISVIDDVSKAKVEIGLLRPRLVLIDLTAGELAASSAMSEYVAIAGPDIWLVAFGPHVDSEALASAKTAGCQVVLPRSKFACDLPRLLQFYFSRLPRRLRCSW